MLVRCEATEIFGSQMELKNLPSCSRTICVSSPGKGACIELLDIGKIDEEDNFLVCPSCWHAVTKDKKQCSPYMVRFNFHSSPSKLMHRLYKALYLRRTRQGVQPNPVFVVNRRSLTFFPHLNIPNTLLLDISHQDFAGYRMAYESIKVSLAEFSDARRVVKYKTIDLTCTKTKYQSDVKKIQTWIER